MMLLGLLPVWVTPKISHFLALCCYTIMVRQFWALQHYRHEWVKDSGTNNYITDKVHWPSGAGSLKNLIPQLKSLDALHNLIEMYHVNGVASMIGSPKKAMSQIPAWRSTSI